MFRREREGKSREEKGKRERATEKREEKREMTEGEREIGGKKTEKTRGDDSGVGWLIRRGEFLKEGGNGGMKRRAQALLNPHQPLRFQRACALGLVLVASFPQSFLIPSRSQSLPSAISFTPTEIIFIGVTRRLRGFARARCNLCRDGSFSEIVPLSSMINLTNIGLLKVSQILTSTFSILHLL